jgi:two-component sensor histidine kinase
METPGSGGAARRLAAVAAGATVIALFFGAQKVVGAAVHGQAVRWRLFVGGELYYWYLLAAFLPLVLWLAGRVRIRRGQRFRTAVVHSIAALLIGLAHSILYYAPLAMLVRSPGPLWQVVAQQLPTAMMTVFWKYWVVIGVYYAFDYHRKYREREDHAAVLERSLTEARLQALRMQLNPHFLFNTLHTISMLNLENAEAANRVLSRLSELLRVALDSEGVQEVRLADELDFVRRYLEIERVRFEDRLRVEFSVNPDLLDAYVPNLLLQPLVENAVRHGLAPRRRAGTISIAARRAGEALVLEVCDDGSGLPDPGDTAPREGIGLENTRARLSELYGAAARLQLLSSPTAGVCALVEIPIHTRPWVVAPAADRVEEVAP